MGMSLGGYFAARAAAFEPRIRALVTFDGVFDYFQAICAMVPPSAMSVLSGPADVVDSALSAVMNASTSARWAVTNGMWTHGVASPHAFVQALRAYTLEGVVQSISCPTLVLSAEQDHFFRGQPEELYRRLTCTKTYLSFTTDEGAEEHCHEGAMALFHQRVFDWLDETLAAA
jgi:pimeloyl-ACP methyl ester carboxylesterase